MHLITVEFGASKFSASVLKLKPFEIHYLVYWMSDYSVMAVQDGRSPVHYYSKTKMWNWRAQIRTHADVTEKQSQPVL